MLRNDSSKTTGNPRARDWMRDTERKRIISFWLSSSTCVRPKQLEESVNTVSRDSRGRWEIREKRSETVQWLLMPL